jgi:hypothetical protein
LFRGAGTPALSLDYRRLDIQEKVREAMRLRDGVAAEWIDYVQDLRSVYLRPLLEDVSVPATARFFQCRERVENLAPLAELLLQHPIKSADRAKAASRATEYLTAAAELATAWTAADENARAVGIGLMDSKTKASLGKVRSLLNRAQDERTGAAERENCRQRILQILSDMDIRIAAPARERAVTQVQPAQWRQLTAPPVDFGQADQQPCSE